MEHFENISKPSKTEQKVAMKSYNALAEVLKSLHIDNPEVVIEETNERIRIPLKALKLLAEILKVTSQGKPISIVPVAMEMTTQAAADLLGCSRPHLVKLLEEGKIEFTKIGKHRRVKFEDVLAYKKRKKEEQQELLINIMNADEDSGMYDTQR
jgi:excisionase family DNA binding protein